MNGRTILLAIAIAAAGAFAAADTSLVLKPDAKRIAASKSVENKKCPVSGEEIGSMGAARVVVYKGKAVKLCCAGCVKAFAKDPAKFLAIAEQPEGAHDSHEGHDHH
jgi:YHS domain-containing protein